MKLLKKVVLAILLMASTFVSAQSISQSKLDSLKLKALPQTREVDYYDVQTFFDTLKLESYLSSPNYAMRADSLLYWVMQVKLGNVGQSEDTTDEIQGISSVLGINDTLPSNGKMYGPGNFTLETGFLLYLKGLFGAQLITYQGDVSLVAPNGSIINMNQAVFNQGFILPDGKVVLDSGDLGSGGVTQNLNSVLSQGNVAWGQYGNLRGIVISGGAWDSRIYTDSTGEALQFTTPKQGDNYSYILNALSRTYIQQTDGNTEPIIIRYISPPGSVAPIGNFPMLELNPIGPLKGYHEGILHFETTDSGFVVHGNIYADNLFGNSPGYSSDTILITADVTADSSWIGDQAFNKTANEYGVNLNGNGWHTGGRVDFFNTDTANATILYSTTHPVYRLVNNILTEVDSLEIPDAVSLVWLGDKFVITTSTGGGTSSVDTEVVNSLINDSLNVIRTFIYDLQTEIAGLQSQINNMADSLAACGCYANTPPTSVITAPADAQTFGVDSVFTVTVTANDPDGSIDSVGFFVDGAWFASDASSAYTATLPTSTPGTFVLRARAWDNQQAYSDDSITYTVSAGGADVLGDSLYGYNFTHGGAEFVGNNWNDVDDVGSITQGSIVVTNSISLQTGSPVTGINFTVDSLPPNYTYAASMSGSTSSPTDFYSSFYSRGMDLWRNSNDGDMVAQFSVKGLPPNTRFSISTFIIADGWSGLESLQLTVGEETGTYLNAKTNYATDRESYEVWGQTDGAGVLFIEVRGVKDTPGSGSGMSIKMLGFMVREYNAAFTGYGND